MKSMFQFIAAAVCAATLVACGGGGPEDKTVVIPAQPDYSVTAEKVGTGDRAAKAGDTVVIKYTGYLYDSATKGKGAKVDVSASPTVTFTVGVGAVYPGWDQTLLGMRAGGTRTAILPQNLAFGAGGRAKVTVGGVEYPEILSYTPLVYDFEMVSVIAAVIVPSTTFTDAPVGTGAEAVSGKTVSVKYTGWLADPTAANGKGKQFDSNASGTTTLDFVVDATPLKVITGFNIGVRGMKVGGKRTVSIPSYQGYGTTPVPDASGAVLIPANSNLVFDIELIAVK